ncbi:MAG: YceI family protein [Pseudomonadota bacterium]
MSKVQPTRSKLSTALIITTALAGFAMPAQAADLAIPSGTYTNDPTHTSFLWSVNHLGLSEYTARFNTVEATVELDADDISNSTLTATIDMGSVDTDFPFPQNTDFNAELRGSDWLNVPDHPQATFTSTQVTKTGDTTATVAGDLSFRGLTLPVTLDVELIGALEQHPFMPVAAFGIQATGTIDRSEFGFDRFVPNVGAAVAIEINAEFLQQM